MGWNETFLQSAVDTCTNASGQITDCPLFDIQVPSVYGNCNFTLPSALENENVVNPTPSLPGNVAIVSGPGYAMTAQEGGAGSAPPPTSAAGANPVPTLSHSAGFTVASSASYVPGAAFAEVSSATAYSALPPAITPVPSASSDTQSYFSTSYSTSGHVVNEVLWEEEIVTVTASATMTLAARKRHLHHHQQRGLRFAESE